MNIEEIRYYIDLIPYNDAKKYNLKYDKDKKQWYSLSPNNELTEKYKKSFIDFKQFQKENSLFFDNENKKWFTYHTNDTFEEYIN
jgi:hypothetical protein